jgi:hypothetical protein
MGKIAPPAATDQRTITLRTQGVLLGADLASAYGVTTRRLNEQVTRNRERFPADSMFQPTRAEADALRSQNAISEPMRGGRRTLSWAYGEQGALMRGCVLNSPVAPAGSIQVVRAFARLRELVAVHHDLAKRLEVLEARLKEHFRVVFGALRALMEPPQTPAQPAIGFISYAKVDEG